MCLDPRRLLALCGAALNDRSRPGMRTGPSPAWDSSERPAQPQTPGLPVVVAEAFVGTVSQLRFPSASSQILLLTPGPVQVVGPHSISGLLPGFLPGTASKGVQLCCISNGVRGLVDGHHAGFISLSTPGES